MGWDGEVRGTECRGKGGQALDVFSRNDGKGLKLSSLTTEARSVVQTADWFPASSWSSTKASTMQ